MSEIVDTLIKLADKYGFTTALSLLLVGGALWYINRLWTARLSDKDKEIERLVTEKNRLQDLLIDRRLSSKD